MSSHTCGNFILGLGCNKGIVRDSGVEGCPNIVIFSILIKVEKNKFINFVSVGGSLFGHNPISYIKSTEPMRFCVSPFAGHT